MVYLPVVTLLQQRLPHLLAVYAFGSRVRGEATATSDLDLAVLVEGYADPVQLFDLAGELADLAGCPVDLLDFRAALTVMQHQILTTGERWWGQDPAAGVFEAAVMNDKLDLDAARALLLKDIEDRGRIYG